ncbi:PhzF family phenazine biosynthesis protein [Weissella paramesenteroides]|uniref:PhzF family phenazine biosynthesis protein n=1 Tax=Weissella paramesenteroides TaxID=1249 RepID=UPI0024029157|nr:PhzF family phenazine biosynthesis protein [Weissella paramesenteroides]MDF8366222.1 PhzF family phenazine biosynthesis protein [Weissella paramesenteroides]
MLKRATPFKQIDVFTQVPFKGNPVAVVLDGDKLSTTEMQQIANWIHLSETTFVCTPTNSQADYRLRIFTPQNELPFAGHPTIGSAYAVLKSGLIPKHGQYLVQECQQGLVRIDVTDAGLFLTLPESKKSPLQEEQVKAFSKALGVSASEIHLAETIDVGAVWYTLQLSSAEQVLALQPDMNLLTQVIAEGVTGVTVFGQYPENSQTNFEVRSFAPNEGADEDPVCGSGNGCVAVMVRDHQLLSSSEYVASQGSCLGRDGYVKVKYSDDNKILLGGFAEICIDGQLSI